MKVRKSEDRGTANFSWLKSRHTFSFGHYYDPQFMGFGHLRVINEDKVEPGGGFATHGHADMEIISYVLQGALEHKDSLGSGSVIRPGDVQRMSAGTGVRHSEYNHSDSAPVHFLQIWIEPSTQGGPPGYEQKHFPLEQRQGQWQLMVSPEKKDEVIFIQQDAYIYSLVLQEKHKQEYQVRPGRCAWMQIAKGKLSLNGIDLEQGDGVAIEEPGQLMLSGIEDAEVLLIDMGAKQPTE